MKKVYLHLYFAACPRLVTYDLCNALLDYSYLMVSAHDPHPNPIHLPLS